MTKTSSAYQAASSEDQTQQEDSVHILDLPQLYQKPSKDILVAALDLLALQPATFLSTKRLLSISPKRSVNASTKEITAYLTCIISSHLAWLSDDDERELIWDLASKRITERAGRTAMSSMTRKFQIPRVSVGEEDGDDDIEIELYEPALTGDQLGHKTWSSAYVLARMLPNLLQYLPMASTLASTVTATQALELGAGTGLLGLAFAALTKCSVVLTDLPEIVENLHKNVQSNAAQLQMVAGSSVRAAVLDWTRPREVFSYPELQLAEEPSKASIILSADSIYAPLHPSMLVRTIEYHIDRNDSRSRVVIAHPLRSAYAPQIAELHRELLRIGLKIIVNGVEENVKDDWDQEITVAWSIWGWHTA